jgi:hypothetical protein
VVAAGAGRKPRGRGQLSMRHLHSSSYFMFEACVQCTKQSDIYSFSDTRWLYDMHTLISGCLGELICTEGLKAAEPSTAAASNPSRLSRIIRSKPGKPSTPICTFRKEAIHPPWVYPLQNSPPLRQIGPEASQFQDAYARSVRYNREKIAVQGLSLSLDIARASIENQNQVTDVIEIPWFA